MTYFANTATSIISRLRRILPSKRPFFVRQKMQISSKILPEILNSAVNLLCAVNLLYKVLPKQFWRLLASTFFRLSKSASF